MPTTKDIDLLITAPEDFEHSHKAMLEHAAQVCAENQVLHWPFAFVEVMAQGGFDCVLGNPPWEKPQLEDEQWFGSRYPAIASAGNGSKRDNMIASLSSGQLAENNASLALYSDPKEQKSFEFKLFAEYVKADFQTMAPSAFRHLDQDDGGRFRLTGFGRANLFAYFAELGLTIVNTHGAMGMVLPAGILTDKATMRFTQKVMADGLVRSIYHFNNSSGKRPIFPV